jgi:hypothetical protein
MGAFRKFDPYSFLANQEAGSLFEADAKAPETLAELATLAEGQPQSANERSGDAPDSHEAPIYPAEAAKFAKVGDCGPGTLAALATLESARPGNGNVSFGSALAKAAKLANLSPAGVRVNGWGATQEERAAIVEYDGNIPRAWAEGFARLDLNRPPGAVPTKRWRCFVDDVGRFVDGPFCAVAATLGWGSFDLFGCDRTRPFARIDQAGLLWLLNGDKLIALTENTASIETQTGARQTYRRKPNEPGRVLAWELT